jgi:hypothetical protein
VTEAYRQTKSNLLVPKALAPTAEVSPQVPDPLKWIEPEMDELNYLLKHGLTEGITRENFPNLPVEVLYLGNVGVTKNQIKLLEEDREKNTDPATSRRIGGLMTRVARNCKNRVNNLLNEVDEEVDEELINQFLKDDSFQLMKPGLGFTFPKLPGTPVIYDDLQPTANE